MPKPEAFLTTSLRAHPYGHSLVRILTAALQAVEPGQAVQRFVRRSGSRLSVAGQEYALNHMKRIRILGVGKAALAMTLPLIEILGDLSPRGLLIPKGAFPSPWVGCQVQPGGHPVPNENSLKAGTKALEFVRGLNVNDLLICLISGGGSALMTAPYSELSLADLQVLTTALLACGARIDEINLLRRHLDRVKGGGLALEAAPARVIGLILSDVVGNPLETIASGPTAPDPTTRTEALAVLRKYDLSVQIPKSLLHLVETAPETPKPGNEIFLRVQNVIVGSNLLAARAALKQAKMEGFQTRFLGAAWQGEASVVAKKLCARLKVARKKRGGSSPICWVAGGETTVTLHGNGLGGRNQELALAAVHELAGLENVMLLSLATDGEDGPTDAAGAVVTGETWERAISLGLDPQVFLKQNNSYRFFEALGGLLKPGPSGTNVNDLTFLFAF